MEIFDLGKIEYQKGLDLQLKHLDEVDRLRDNPLYTGRLLVCEHPTVITVGRGIDSLKEVFTDSVVPVEVSRGGRATLHNPGQIVIYPIVDLRKRGSDLHSYLRVLEEAVITTLAEFGIAGFRVEDKTGVWVKVGEVSKKIASLGIAVRKWISYHGIALNVVNNLSEFEMLNPCGMGFQVMTSVKSVLDYKQSDDILLNQVKKALVDNIVQVLGKGYDS